MEKKHPLAQRACPNSPTKKTPSRGEIIKTHDHGRSTKKHLELTQTPVCTNTDSKTPSKRQTPYTETFFGSLAQTIVDTFPFKTFAKNHGCGVEDVIIAIRKTVVVPLSKPFKVRVDAESQVAGEMTKSSITDTSIMTEDSGFASQTSQTEITNELFEPIVTNISKGTQTAEPTVECPNPSDVAMTIEPIISMSSRATQTAEPAKEEVTPTKPTSSSISPFKIPDRPQEAKRRRTSTNFPDRSPVKQDIFGKYVTSETLATEVTSSSEHKLVWKQRRRYTFAGIHVAKTADSLVSLKLEGEEPNEKVVYHKDMWIGNDYDHEALGALIKKVHGDKLTHVTKPPEEV
ncbi:hypothetical protein BDV19DRAFT_384051 [Aspergillus venezuelensis]